MLELGLQSRKYVLLAMVLETSTLIYDEGPLICFSSNIYIYI